MIGIESVIPLMGSQEFKIAATVIKLLREALREDISEVLKGKIADSELHTAQSVLDSLGLEAEHNLQHGMNRVITHLETAFTLYNEKNEFDSSCVCAMYLSVMHNAVGNSNSGLHKSIWQKVPVIKDSIDFGGYSSYVRKFLSASDYNSLVQERRERRIRMLDIEIEALKFVPVPRSANSLMGGMLEILKAEKRSLQGIRDDRSIFKKALDMTFWRYS